MTSQYHRLMCPIVERARYFDEYQSKIVMSPKLVVFFIVLVIVLEIILHTFF